jgi:hypothetical protein
MPSARAAEPYGLSMFTAPHPNPFHPISNDIIREIDSFARALEFAILVVGGCNYAGSDQVFLSLRVTRNYTLWSLSQLISAANHFLHRGRL